MKICPGCGSAMEDSAAFCTKCGTKFNNNSAENTSSTEHTQNTGTATDSGTACNPNNGAYTNAANNNHTNQA